MKEVIYTVAENTLLTADVYRMRLTGDTSAITAPGQFLELRLPGFFLRRPLSICDWDERGVTLLYKVVGGGTDWLRRCAAGQPIDALSGLGNGFDTAACGSATALVGGGIGIAPLYGLARRLLAAGKTPVAVLGYNTAAEMFWHEEFRALGINVTVATAVEVGAANLTQPFACHDIIRDLPRVMAAYGIHDLTEIIGGAHHG